MIIFIEEYKYGKIFVGAEKNMKFVIDMMGGDNGLKATIPATKELLEKHKDVVVYLIGQLDQLSDFQESERVHLIESKTVLAMDVDPMTALKEKDSSLMVGIKTYLENDCDALISAGSTGAILSAAIFKIKQNSQKCLLNLNLGSML